MQLVSIEFLKCIRWYLAHHPTPDKILVCADYEYQYILHHFKGWPVQIYRINTYEEGWEVALAEAKKSLTPNSMLIARPEILDTFRAPMECVD